MKGIKLDRYAIYEKGREYEVLVFPFIKYMWVFDGGPAEDGLYISGSEYSYAMLRYVFALLASDPGKLVFFPCRQPGVEGMFEPNYHLVLYRPELQFRRSLWVKIKKKIDRKNWKGRYVLCYDGKKTDDYYENVLRKKYGCTDDQLPNRAFNTQPWGVLEEIVGETFFVQTDRNICYEMHYYTGQDIKAECREGIPFWYTYLGQIWSEESVRKWDTMAAQETESDKKESSLAEKEYPPDMSCTIGRTRRLQIYSEPNDTEGLFYFKAFNRNDSRIFYRVSMTEPRVIGAGDETLELTEGDVKEIISLFNEECVDCHKKPLGCSNWEYLVESNNNEAIGDKDECPNIYVDDSLPMPDYARLFQTAERKKGGRNDGRKRFHV